MQRYDVKTSPLNALSALRTFSDYSCYLLLEQLRTVATTGWWCGWRCIYKPSLASLCDFSLVTFRWLVDGRMTCTELHARSLLSYYATYTLLSIDVADHLQLPPTPLIESIDIIMQMHNKQIDLKNE